MKRVDEVTGNNKVIVRVCPPSSILPDNYQDNEDCVERRIRSDSFSTVNTLTNSLGIGETVVDANPTLAPINHDLEPVCCVVCTEKEIHLKEPPNEYFKQGKEKITTFTFDGVFPSLSLSSIPPPLEEKVIIDQQNQLDIYKNGFVATAVENVIKGVVPQDNKQSFNEVIISYGPTGSGKTYTMFGSGLCPGLLPRAFSDLFFKLEATGDNYTVELSVVEVYNSLFIDLLETSKQKKLQLSATTTSVKQNLAIEKSNRLARTPSSSSYVSKLFATNNIESSPTSEGTGSPSSCAETIQSLFYPPRASSAQSSPDDDEQMRSVAGRKSSGAAKTVVKPMKKTTFNSSVYATPINSKANAKKTSPATAKYDGPHGKGFTAEGKEICCRLRVYSATEALELVRHSRRRRKTAKSTCASGNLDMSASTTHKTYDSSRGHLICTLHVKTDHGSGKLMFIDLAGTHSGTSSMESHHINLSLLTLGEVLQSLSFNTDAAVRKSQQQPSARRQSYSNVPSSAFQSSPTTKALVTTRVPYMDSKLTQLLADHSHIVLVAHIQPEQEYYSNTLRTLNYASKGRPLLRPPTVQFTRRRTVAGGEGKSMMKWPPKESLSPNSNQQQTALTNSESQDQPPSALLVENQSLKQQLSFLQNQVVMLSKFPPKGRKSDCFSETSSAVSSPLFDINQPRRGVVPALVGAFSSGATARDTLLAPEESALDDNSSARLSPVSDAGMLRSLSRSFSAENWFHSVSSDPLPAAPDGAKIASNPTGSGSLRNKNSQLQNPYCCYNFGK